MGKREGSNFVLLLLAVQFPQHHPLKRLFFFFISMYVFGTFAKKLDRSSCVDLFLDLLSTGCIVNAFLLAVCGYLREKQFILAHGFRISSVKAGRCGVVFTGAEAHGGGSSHHSGPGSKEWCQNHGLDHSLRRSFPKWPPVIQASSLKGSTAPQTATKMGTNAQNTILWGTFWIQAMVVYLSVFMAGLWSFHYYSFVFILVSLHIK